ncbi:MAG TPA: hypothetical protein PLO07_16620 [Rubrivivax sp.]|jgi:hypothetical protein|nr:hypothetical protein [Rubrivivax sp.]
MKQIPLRARPLVVQTDLFDAVTVRTPLTSLQLHRDELIDLLSQLLWQVASQDDVQRPEDDDEQDQS